MIDLTKATVFQAEISQDSGNAAYNYNYKLNLNYFGQLAKYDFVSKIENLCWSEPQQADIYEGLMNAGFQNRNHRLSFLTALDGRQMVAYYWWSGNQ